MNKQETPEGACPPTNCSSLCLAHGATPRTDVLTDADFHKLDDDFAPVSAYDRLADLCRDMEREANWNEEAWRRVAESRAVLQEALKTVIVLASENPDMLVMHILASDSPIRRAWEMSRTNPPARSSGTD